MPALLQVQFWELPAPPDLPSHPNPTKKNQSLYSHVERQGITGSICLQQSQFPLEYIKLTPIFFFWFFFLICFLFFYYSRNFQICLRMGQGEDKDRESEDVNLDRDQAGEKTPGKVVSWPILLALKKLCH